MRAIKISKITGFRLKCQEINAQFLTGFGAPPKRFDENRPNDYVTAMTIRPLVILPDPLLRVTSTPVENIDGATKAFVEDMFETMYEAPGVGLAAVQVGLTQRIVTMDASRGDDEKQPLALINPEIIWMSDELKDYEEGCLSIPDFHEVVTRPAKVGMRFLNLDGKIEEREMDELAATVIQHEIDHLNGKLFIDHISKLKRDRVIKKFQKMARQFGEG
jgi:peptide deformylase